MNLNKEQLNRAYEIIDGKNAKISQLEKERDELKARVEELEKKAAECICCIPMK